MMPDSGKIMKNFILNLASGNKKINDFAAEIMRCDNNIGPGKSLRAIVSCSAE
jgi:hypothetical protein